MIDIEMRNAINEACRDFGQPEAVARHLIAMLENIDERPMDAAEKQRFLQNVLGSIVRDSGRTP